MARSEPTLRKSYADAPRLPLSPDHVDVRTLAVGEHVEIEIGPGRGAFLLERAVAEPRAALIGFEIKKKWASVVDARLCTAGHAKRARVFAEDARVVLARLVPDASVRRFFLNFPDPWWKKKHQKRAIVADPLLVEIARLLEPRGELFIQTDVRDRAEAYDARILATKRFEGGAVIENPYGARSNREKRVLGDGLPVHRSIHRLNL